jgi:hypothetical protein
MNLSEFLLIVFRSDMGDTSESPVVQGGRVSAANGGWRNCNRGGQVSMYLLEALTDPGITLILESDSRATQEIHVRHILNDYLSVRLFLPGDSPLYESPYCCVRRTSSMCRVVPPGEST